MSEQTRREAERIAFNRGSLQSQQLELADTIDCALRARDERAAKIAESMRPSGGRMWTDEQTACFEALTDCAANIRKDDA